MAEARYHQHTPKEEPVEVLERRTAELSRERPESEEEVLNVVLFQIGSERAAIPAEYVGEVVSPVNRPTRVPGTPDFVLGVVNLRGRIVACLDIGAFLGIASSFVDSLPFMLLTAFDDIEVGIAADDVSEVISVPAAKIEPPSSVLNAESARFIKGILYVNKHPLSLVDLEGLIRCDRIERLREDAK